MQYHKGLVNSLVEQGFRLTPQRMMVLEAIEESTNHISAEDIYAQVCRRYPNVNISTVYRTLELLKKLNLVTETAMGGGRVSYHPSEKGRHHHLICAECGSVTDLHDEVFEPLKKQMMALYGFEADLRHLGIFGSCAKCRQGNE
ncbi:Fur family transcriptional regulator [Chloroflexota bacterium]